MAGPFALADTIVPSGVQGLDRYAYVNNSPLRYTDPTGHDVQCTLDDGCWETNNNGSLGAPVPGGLNAYGEAAYGGLQALGLLGNLQSAITFIVATENRPEMIDPNPTPATTLTRAMTRRYYEYRSGGAWTASCLNAFWGYMQAVWEGTNPTKRGDNFEKVASAPNAQDLAAAILNPGQEYGGFNVTPSLATQGCEPGGYLCNWANPPTNAAVEAIKYRPGTIPGADNSSWTHILSPDNKG